MKTLPHFELTGIDFGAVEPEAGRIGNDLAGRLSVCGVPFYGSGLWKIYAQYLARRQSVQRRSGGPDADLAVCSSPPVAFPNRDGTIKRPL